MKTINTNEPAICIQNLDHYFGSGQLRKQVLFNINLEIQAGEIVIMTGPSGSPSSHPPQSTGRFPATGAIPGSPH